MLRRNDLLLPIGLTAVAVVGTAETADAMTYAQYQRQLEAQMTVLRIGLMALASISGFALGWLLSPRGKKLRLLIGLLLSGAAVLLAVFDHSVLGWSSAIVVAVVGFFAGLGYWVAEAVKVLGEVPTTFGSAKWADG
ncbi:MAG: type IV secretory system conjugative DNA transfer family protein, partial [Pseudomonadota bacterium]